ncbi:lysylphosphatidylglycerol synthase transmembrane domain-containing protein [Thermodesulfobacteriota bacterium]
MKQIKDCARSRTFNLSFFLRLTVLVFSFWLLGRSVELDKLMIILFTIPWQVTIAAISIVFFRFYLAALRWKLLSPSATGLATWQLIRLLFVASALSLFLPGVAGADVARSILVTREVKSEAGGAFLSVFFDRLIGLFSIVVLGLIACVLASHLENRVYYGGLFSLTGLAMVLLVLISRMENLHQTVKSWVEFFGAPGRWLAVHMEKVIDALSRYRPEKSRIMLSFLLCIPIHGLWFVMVYMVSQAIGVQIGFSTLSIITSLVWVITVAPVSIAGFGVRELSFVYLMSFEGVVGEQTAVIALFQSLMVVLTGTVGLFFVLVGKTNTKRSS